jgi:hypothetical protein
MFGDSAKATICFYLRKNYHLEKDEIPRRIDEFSYAIREILGLGGPAIEKLILSKLCEKRSITFGSVNDCEFLVSSRLSDLDNWRIEKSTIL